MSGWVFWVPFTLSALVYALTMCPSVYVEGSGELIGAVSMLGTPHPTGYPLFCLLGRVIVAVLPLGNPALEVNIASALTCAGAAAALSAFLNYRGLHPWTAVGAALVFAFSSTFWSQAVIAEVYGLSMLAAVVVLAAWARAFDRPQERRLVLAAFATGLAATTHLSQFLLLPGIGLLGLYRWRTAALERAARDAAAIAPAALRDVRKTGVRMVVAAIAGYSLILYLPLRSGRGSGFHWNPVDTPAALWDHVTAVLYRSSFYGMPWEGALINATRFGHQMTAEFPALCWAPLAWGVWVALSRDRAVAWMTAGAAVANVLAALNYHRDPNGLDVFFLLAILGAVIFLAYGLDDLARRLGRALHGRRQATAGFVAALVVLAVLGGNHRQADRSGNRVAERYGRDILQSLPPSALLLTEGDDASFILDYLHRVESVRADVTLYNKNGLGMADGSRAPSMGDRRARARMLRHAEREMVRNSMAAGRPVFSVFARALAAAEFEFVPYGLVYQVVGGGDSTAGSPIGVPAIDAAHAETSLDGFADPWIRKILANYWFMEGENRAREGWSKEAMRAYLKAAEVADQSRTTQFNVARILFLNNELEEALRYALRAVEIDPLWSHSYPLAIRILRRLGRAEEARALDRKAAQLGRYS